MVVAKLLEKRQAEIEAEVRGSPWGSGSWDRSQIELVVGPKLKL